MTKNFRDSYSPYGAFELKAKYQRNMLFGTFVTSALVVVLVGGIWLATAHSGVDDDLGGGKIDQRFILEPPPKITKDRPVANVRRRIIEEIPLRVPPIMVDDDEFIVEDEIEMNSHDELEVFGTTDTNADVSNGGDDSQFYGTDDGDYFPAEGEFVFVEIQPEMIHEVVPEYPRLAKLAGIDGRVKISALISAEGYVIKANVAVSSGNNSLDNAALSVAKQNKFKPAVQNSHPIAIWVVYTVEFVLSN